MPIRLDKAKTLVPYKIVKCDLPEEYKLRFAEMGIAQGGIVTVKKRAPLGDPLEITVKGYSLCVRAKQAKHIVVEVIQ